MTAGKKPSDEELLLDVEFLTIQQVATWAKVSTKSIYRWIETGKIPVVKIGKRTYRIPARAVIAQLKAAGYELVVPEKKGISNMAIQSKHLVLLALIVLPACVSSGAQSPSPIYALEMAGSSRETAVAAISTSDYYAYQVTATVEAHNMQLTERAQSMDYTATARVWDATSTAASSQSTSTAAAVATSNTSQATETQHAFNITSTADYAAVQAYATQQYAQAKQAELSVERLELTNKIGALVPWVMLITMFVAAVVLIRNWSRFRVIHRDQYGDAPLLLNVIDSVAVDMDRNPSSTAGLQRQDLKQLPKFSSTTQEQVTVRDQLVEMSSRNRSLTGDGAVRKALARQIADSALSSPSSNSQL